MNASLSPTISKWLDESTVKLKVAGIATARLDCLVLAEDATSQDRSYLLAHPETPLQGVSLKRLNMQISRREGHEPLAYIRGKSEFYGREFAVNNHTLEPRPETETMIDLLQQLLVLRAQGEGFSLADIGTGSGCIGITVKLEFPEAEVVGIDISKECLKIAEQNAQKHGADVRFFHGDLLEPISALRSGPSALLCNLPYVPDAHTINQAAMQEPKLAIFGGPDGLDLYRRLFKQIKEYGIKPRLVMTESLPFQHKALAEIAHKAGYKVRESEDFIQVFTRV